MMSGVSMVPSIFVSFLMLFGLLELNMAHSGPTWPNRVNPSVQHCPIPSEHVLKCLNEWVCQSVVNLDLRCLVNINGQPLLRSLLNTLNGLTGNAGGFPLVGPLLGR